MNRDELLKLIASTRERIANYRAQDLCDMQLDAALACDDSSLAVYDALLYHDGNLTPAGVATIAEWAAKITECVDQTAAEHGLLESVEEAA